jgi:hypothetical protein
MTFIQKHRSVVLKEHVYDIKSFTLKEAITLSDSHNRKRARDLKVYEDHFHFVILFNAEFLV